jgi:microcystin degradation protein MlrC
MSRSRLKIAAAGIAHESCTFSPVPTRLEDFTILEGNELSRRYPFLPRYPGAVVTPVLRAHAVPGGPIEAPAYHTLRHRLLAGLDSRGPWDGVYLDLHGAMFVHGMGDAEADLVAAVRKRVGPGTPIAASFDLHGNLSPALVQALDALTAFRTAPHVDTEQTCERALTLLLRRIETGKAFHLECRNLPLLFPGERAVTTAPPARELYARIPQLIDGRGVLDVSILIGYAWADEARTGLSVVALGRDRCACKEAADSLAAEVWAARREFAFPVPTGTVDECIDLALASHERPFFISDAGDNVTGGAVGDVPAVLARLVDRRVEGAVFASIVDAEVAQTCTNVGTGGQVDVEIGGKLDTVNGTRLSLRAAVVALNQDRESGRQALIAAGGVRAIITERRTAFTTIRQFRALGVDPARESIVVVKLGYLFPELAEVSRASVMALSPGVLDPRVEQLPFRHARRPIYPIDSLMEWSP